MCGAWLMSQEPETQLLILILAKGTGGLNNLINRCLELTYLKLILTHKKMIKAFHQRNEVCFSCQKAANT
jgi:hypothetical protein